MANVQGPVSSTDNAIVRWDGTGGDTVQNSGVTIDDSNIVTGVFKLTLPHEGLRILTDGSPYYTQIENESTLTADRTLKFVTSDANRMITILGDAIVSQDYSITGSPTFADLAVTSIIIKNPGLRIEDTNATHHQIIRPASNLTADRTLNIATGDADRTFTLTGDFTASGSTSGTNTGDQTTSGTANRITVTNGTTNPVVDIASTYAGQTSITTLGTITTGTWNGSVIGSSFGGAGSVNGVLKANGSGTVSAATAGTDYAPATTGNFVLKGNGAGGFTNATAGTDYAPATSGTSILKGNGSGGFSNAVAGTDYLAPNGNGSGLTGITAGQASYDPSTSGQPTSVDTVQEGIDACFSTFTEMNGGLCPHTHLHTHSVSNSTARSTADQLILFNASRYARRFSAFEVTLDITTSGAGGLDTGSEAASTWYHIWAIAKVDGTQSAVFSTNSAAPTLPSGYVFYGYVGAVYNDSSSNFVSFNQRGNIVDFGTTGAVLLNGTATTFTAVSLAAYMPPTASVVNFNFRVGKSSGTAGTFMVVTSHGAGTTPSFNGVTVESPSGIGSGDIYSFGSLPLLGGIEIYYYVSGTNARGSINPVGYEF